MIGKKLKTLFGIGPSETTSATVDCNATTRIIGTGPPRNLDGSYKEIKNVIGGSGSVSIHGLPVPKVTYVTGATPPPEVAAIEDHADDQDADDEPVLDWQEFCDRMDDVADAAIERDRNKPWTDSSDYDYDPR